MYKEIRFSSYSNVCLKEIAQTIAKDSEKRAEAFIDNILSKINSLLEFPNLGKLIKGNVRKLVIHKNYVVFYRVEEKEIYILSIKNSKFK